MDKQKKVIGTLEKVEFPKFKINNTIAKIDTGAYTGALHCTKIKEISKDGESVLAFSPFDHPSITIRTKDFSTRFVKSSNGQRERRYLIKTDIKIQGKTYDIVLSLANRRGMKWEVLIGRRFLRNNHFLVDVKRGHEYLEQHRRML